MEQDMEHSSSEHAGLTKKLVSKGSKEYGTIQSFEVDATIPFIPLDSTATNQEVTRSTSTMNGSSVDDGIPFQRRIHRPTGGALVTHICLAICYITLFSSFQLSVMSEWTRTAIRLEL